MGHTIRLCCYTTSYEKRKLKHIELQLLGQCKVSISTEEEEKVDKAHHKNATAPNLIHSLDASLLALSTIRFNAPVALIHDSVLCRATDMGVLSSIVRETYMHLFAQSMTTSRRLPCRLALKQNHQSLVTLNRHE